MSAERQAFIQRHVGESRESWGQKCQVDWETAAGDRDDSWKITGQLVLC